MKQKQLKPEFDNQEEQRLDLFERTNCANPNPKDVALVKEVFDKMPVLYRLNGNLQDQIFTRILNSATRNSVFTRMAAERAIEEMKAEFGYHSATFIEKMLIDEILMRWLRLQVMENDHISATYEEHTFAKGIYYDKRLHLAQERYLKAVTTLAKVRKMIAATQAKGAEMIKNLMLQE